MIVKRKAPEREAWQYITGLYAHAPAWAKDCTGFNSMDQLILKRRSGRQVINHTDWLVNMKDEPAHLTHEEMKFEYEVVVS